MVKKMDSLTQQAQFVCFLKAHKLEEIIHFASKHNLETSKDLEAYIGAFSEHAERHEFWNLIFEVIVDCIDVVTGRKVDEIDGTTPELAAQSVCTFAKMICASLDILSDAPLSLLKATIHLNEQLPFIPAEHEELKDSIATLCVKYWLAGYPQCKSVIHNVTSYLLKQSVRARAKENTKKDIKTLFSIKNSLKTGLSSEDGTYKKKLIITLKMCVQSSDYLSISEGRKLISYILCLDASLVDELHEKVKDKISLCSVAQAKSYGEIYLASWMESYGTGCKELQDALEWVIQDILEHRIFIPKKPGCILPQLKKFVGVFHVKRSDPRVLKLLCRLYSPILWKGLQWHHGAIRANAAHVFVDVFPLEDPDLRVVPAQQELERQTVVLQSLLTDVCPTVRAIAACGVCNIIALQWEILPKDIIATYLLILTEKLAVDETSHEVRLAIITGMKTLLENHFENHILKVVLKQLSILFHDKDERVRIAYCHFLLEVKKHHSIRYWELVPIEDLLTKLEDGTTSVRKLIVQLIYNSYIPSEEQEIIWLQRCIELIKHNLETSRNFFYFVPEVIDIELTFRFIAFICRALNWYVKIKVSQRHSCASTNRANGDESDEKSLGEEDLVNLLEADEGNILIGVIDALYIMFQSALEQFREPKNKKLYKLLLSKIAKYMPALLSYFVELRENWAPLYCLSSMLPPSLLPDFPKMCYDKLLDLSDSDRDEDYTILVKCLCEIENGPQLLQHILNSLTLELHAPLNNAGRGAKRKSSMKLFDIELKAMKASQCLHHLITNEDTSFLILNENLLQIKEFLQLLDSVQERITESKTTLSEKNKDFLNQVFGSIVTLAIQLHQPNERVSKIVDVDEFLRKLMNWIAATFFSPPELQLSHKHSSRRRKANWPLSSSPNKHWKALALSICQGLCVRLCYVVSLHILQEPASDYVAFMKEMMKSEYGPELAQYVMTVILHLSNYCQLDSPPLQQRKENEDLILEVFPEIILMFCNEDFYKQIPSDAKKEIIVILGRLLESQSMITVLSESPIKILMPKLLDGIVFGTVPVVENFVEGNQFTLPSLSMNLISAVLSETKYIEPFLESVMSYVDGKGLVETAAASVIINKVLESSKNVLKKLTSVITKLLQLLKSKSKTFAANADEDRNLIALLRSSIIRIQEVVSNKREQNLKRDLITPHTSIQHNLTEITLQD